MMDLSLFTAVQLFPPSCRSNVRNVGLVMGFVLVLVAGCDTASSMPPLIASAAGSSQVNPSVLNAPRVIDLGTIPAGGRVEKTIEIHNPLPHDVVIAEIEVGCECVTVTLENDLIAAGGSVPAKVVADLSHLPEFRGALGIRVEFRDQDGTYLKGIRIHLAVPSDRDT